MENTIYSDELQHHGVIGMKWGVRRYQNKDGSLTARGKKRLEKLDAERDKITGKKSTPSSSDAYEALRKKKVSELTDDELKKLGARQQAERNYTENKKIHMQNTAEISKMEHKESAGKKFVKKMWNDAVVPALTNAAKKKAQEFLEKQFGKMLGLEGDAVRDVVKETKKAVKDSSAADVINNAAKEVKKQKAKADGKEPEYYEGEVLGKGTSKRTEKKTEPIDAEWRDVPTDSPKVTALVPYGEEYTKRYLLGG